MTTTTKEVRDAYVTHVTSILGTEAASEAGEEFDEWLSEVVKVARVNAWDEGYEARAYAYDSLEHTPNPYE